MLDIPCSPPLDILTFPTSPSGEQPRTPRRWGRQLCGTCHHVSSSRFGPVHDDKGVTAFYCHDGDVVRGFEGTRLSLFKVIRDDLVEAFHLEVLQGLCQGAGRCWIFV